MNFAHIDRGRGLFQHGENTTHHAPHTTTTQMVLQVEGVCAKIAGVCAKIAGVCCGPRKWSTDRHDGVLTSLWILTPPIGSNDSDRIVLGDSGGDKSHPQNNIPPKKVSWADIVTGKR